MRSAAAVVAVVTWMACGAVQAQTTVHYEMKPADLKYVYGVAAPVMHVRPGDTLETTTAECGWTHARRSGAKAERANPLTGPFYIDGAEPGDTLAIHFERVEVNAPVGYGSAGRVSGR